MTLGKNRSSEIIDFQSQLVMLIQTMTDLTSFFKVGTNYRIPVDSLPPHMHNLCKY